KNNLVAYGRVGRVSLTDKLKVDWKNISLFKKIFFQHIPSGKYIVKIFLENTLFDDNRKFIGYSIVDLQKNKTIHIFCKSEGKIRFFVYDLNNNGIENARISLLKQDFEVIKGISDSSGLIKIETPCGLREKYTAYLLYKGFLISKQDIRLGRIRRSLPVIKKISFPVYDLTINFKNSKNEKPDFNVNLSITSDEMYNPIFLFPDSESNGVFYFKNLYPANYTLLIRYNQFEIKKFLSLKDVKSIDISLYDFTIFLKDNWNFSLYPDLYVTLRSNDLEKEVVVLAEKVSSEKFVFKDLYPGNYTLKISYLEHLITMPVSIGLGKNSKKTIILPAEYNLTINVFDARGDFLKDAEVLIFRTENNEKKYLQGFTNDQGNVIFSLPPGSYDCEIYNNKNLVAKRKFDVLNEKSYDVVTISEPIFLNVLIIIFSVLILFSVFVGFKKKDAGFFLKFFAIAIAVISLFYPWWSLNGSSINQYEITTNVFLMPVKMVTIFSSENVTAGETALLNETFTFVIYLLPIIIVTGFLGIVISMILNKYDKKRLSVIVFILTLIIFIGTLMVFYFAMSEFTSSTVGSFYGQGDLEISIPGEKMFVTMLCTWRPGIGFY
ncbi:MAG: hypothetical protein QHH15_07540, partial [Candidatus Thermoplasmatota archaeon]|nr:hypothetical protein [Candidatus Thermoplasmatota archaeon]